MVISATTNTRSSTSDGASAAVTATVPGAVPMRRRDIRETVHRERRASVGDRVQGVVVGTVAVVGLAGALWFAASIVFGLSLVVVLTGSMSPTMPAGSLLVSQQVPASDLSVGDVVTVPRERSTLPVTHRIVAIENAAGAGIAVDSDAATAVGSAVALTLQGDANERVDTEIYTVTQAKRVVLAIPGAGYVVTALSTPWAMGGVVLAIALLVVWVLWPRKTAMDEPLEHAPGTTPGTAPTELA